jgi:DNA-binding XRE family transcriptional regulator
MRKTMGRGIPVFHRLRVKNSLAVTFTISYNWRMPEDHDLRRWRKAEAITLSDLAGRVGVRASHLSEIENWNNKPSLALAVKLSRETGIPIDKFVKQAQAAE